MYEKIEFGQKMNFFKIFSLNSLDMVQINKSKRKFGKKKILIFFKKIENSKYLFYFISNITSNLPHKRTPFFLLIVYFFKKNG